MNRIDYRFNEINEFGPWIWIWIQIRNTSQISTAGLRFRSCFHMALKLAILFRWTTGRAGDGKCTGFTFIPLSAVEPEPVSQKPLLIVLPSGGNGTGMHFLLFRFRIQHKMEKKSKSKNEANFLGSNADSDKDFVHIFWLLKNCAEYCLKNPEPERDQNRNYSKVGTRTAKNIVVRRH